MSRYTIMTPDKNNIIVMSTHQNSSIVLRAKDRDFLIEIESNLINFFNMNGFKVSDLTQTNNLCQSGLSRGKKQFTGLTYGDRIERLKRKKFELTPQSLKVLEYLRENGEDYVSNIAIKLNLNVATISSNHIKRLLRLGFIEKSKKLGARKYYKVI